MTDSEKFAGLKKAQIENNEQQYGAEIREKYGEQAVEEAKKQWLNLSEADYQKMEAVEQELFQLLKVVVTTQDYESPEAQAAFTKHRDWLNYSTSHYSPDMHKGIGEMYVADTRFTEYYDQRVAKNAAATLCKIIQRYA